MSLEIDGCSSDCIVAPGTDFTLSIMASDPPEGGFGAFQSETFFDGLTYHNRPCADDVKLEPLGLCLGPTIGTLGQVSHGGLTGILPPLPPAENDTLATMSVGCSEEGEHELWISAFESLTEGSPLGSRYKGLNGEELLITFDGTKEVTTPDDEVRTFAVADSITVSCEQPPVTPTEEPTGGAVATATPVPGLPSTGTAGTTTGNNGADTWLLIASLVAVAGLLVGGASWRVRWGRRA